MKTKRHNFGLIIKETVPTIPGPASNSAKENGATLVEVLVVSIIMVIILGGALTVYLMSETSWRESTVQAYLQRNASIAIEKMLRGVEGIYGIRDSKAINYYPPSTSYGVQFTGTDNTNRRFYRSESGSGSEIKYYDGSSISTLAEDINNLTFTKHGTERLEIDLTMSQAARDKNISINLITDVTIRN